MKKENSKEGKKIEKMMKIKPLHDRVLIREISAEQTEKKTASGIIIPVTGNEDKGSKKGIVIALGDGKYDDGKLIPISLSVGDEVLYSWGEKVILDGEEYTIVRENDVIAVLN
jgi:chaperonin GroES